jgi:membrane protein DedA with SNARE-associated domain
MTESLGELGLSLLLTYGAPALAFFLLVGAAGLPVPASLILVAAGAFARQEFMDWRLAALWGLTGVALGDSLGFGIGRFLTRGRVRDFLEQSPHWETARETFNSQGGASIYFSRFLFTALAVPVNLLAGGSRYPFGKFFLFMFLGESTWVFLYGGLGYAFGSQWELVSEFLSNFGGLALGIALLAAAIFLWRRNQRLGVESA